MFTDFLQFVFIPHRKVIDEVFPCSSWSTTNTMSLMVTGNVTWLVSPMGDEFYWFENYWSGKGVLTVYDIKLLLLIDDQNEYKIIELLVELVQA